MEYILGDMDREEIIKIEKKYEKAVNMAMNSFNIYKKVKHMQCIKVEYDWNDLFNCFNAESKCKNFEKDEYLITFNAYTPIRLEQLLANKNILPSYRYQIISTVMTFVAWHELFHIIFGHCTMSNEDIDALPNEVKKKFETMCDMKAVDCMFADIDIQEKPRELEIDMYASLFCAFFIYFYILEKDILHTMEENKKHDQENPNGEKKYKTYTSMERTHPFLTFRFDNICDVIEYHLKSKKYNLTEIDNVYYKSKNFAEFLGFKDNLKVNVFYRRNRNSKLNDIDIDYDKMLTYVKKYYLKEE